MISLVNIRNEKRSSEILYDLLLERADQKNVNISHAKTPTVEEHNAFVDNHPYGEWCLISNGSEYVGAIYITKPPRKSIAGNELGIFIFKKHQRCGYAREAIVAMMARHGSGPYYANINPGNDTSIRLFSSLGFGVVQQTMKLQYEAE